MMSLRVRALLLGEARAGRKSADGGEGHEKGTHESSPEKLSELIFPRNRRLALRCINARTAEFPEVIRASGEPISPVSLNRRLWGY
jgi:hypothetical protein